METYQELNQERERLSKLERELSRTYKFFHAGILTTMLCGFVMSASEEKDMGYYAGLMMASVVPTFTAWLNCMSYKTEEYCQLAQKFYCGQRDNLE